MFSRTDISGLERGVRNPTVVVLERIARTLEVPAARLPDEIEYGLRSPRIASRGVV